MKKILVLMGFIFLIFSSLTGCEKSDPSQIKFPETKYEDSGDSVNEVDDEISPPSYEVSDTIRMSGEYRNENFGFTLTLPESWGQVEEIVVYGHVSPHATEITWTSLADSSRYLTISIVPSEERNNDSVIDAPQELITENDSYGFYYSSARDYPNETPTAREEALEAIQTFKLL